MKTWPDVVYKFIDFLKKPTGAGIFIITFIILGFLIAFPWWVLGQKLDNTIRETSKQQITAINQIVEVLKEKKMAGY